MKILIAGARGYIGSVALNMLKAEGSNVLALASHPSSDFACLDLVHPHGFDKSLVNDGDVVLFAAAISSPDICAKEPERVRRVNVEGTGEFISMCMRKGARVIFFSSDTVYGEKTDAVDETAACNPAGDYAMMKYDIESRFLGNRAFKTIRLSYVFSSEDKFTRYLVGCCERGEAAEIFHPFYRALVHRDDVALGAIALARRWDEFSQPVINFGGPDVISRVDFANTLKNHVLPSLSFRQIEPEAAFFTNRPQVIRMQSLLFASLLGRSSHTLREAVGFEFELEGKTNG